jgi:hypothetical protein
LNAGRKKSLIFLVSWLISSVSKTSYHRFHAKCSKQFVGRDTSRTETKTERAKQNKEMFRGLINDPWTGCTRSKVAQIHLIHEKKQHNMINA